MFNSFVTTPFQESGDSATAQSWNNWQNGEMMASLGNSLYARLGYLADLVSSIAIIPIALIGLALGTVQALFVWSTQNASLLNSSYFLLHEKVERLFASSLGAIISPASAYYFRDKRITPMALGLVTTGIASYIIIKNQPQKFDWKFGLGK